MQTKNDQDVIKTYIPEDGDGNKSDNPVVRSIYGNILSDTPVPYAELTAKENVVRILNEDVLIDATKVTTKLILLCNSDCTVVVSTPATLSIQIEAENNEASQRFAKSYAEASALDTTLGFHAATIAVTSKSYVRIQIRGGVINYNIDAN